MQECGMENPPVPRILRVAGHRRQSPTSAIRNDSRHPRRRHGVTAAAAAGYPVRDKAASKHSRRHETPENIEEVPAFRTSRHAFTTSAIRHGTPPGGATEDSSWV